MIFAWPSLWMALLAATPAAHATASAAFTVPVAAPAARAFAMFDPVGERAWAHEWNPRFATDPAPMRAGIVFETDGHGAHGSAVWVVAAYDAERRTIRYVTVDPGYEVTVLTIAVAARGPNAAEAAVQAERTALSAEADADVARSPAHAAATAAAWTHAIAAALGAP